ncbi:MAG: hypothetical protein V3U11_07420 [Planctomycetota bacterium]
MTEQADKPINPGLQEGDKILQSSFREELGSAFRMLFEDHMPLTVMVATLTFPLVVGLGGYLTEGADPMVLPAIAFLPMLSVIALVAVLSRNTLVEAAAGFENPPPLPALGSLLHQSGRLILDTAVMVVVFFGPGVACLVNGMHIGVSAGALALGAILMPMALVLRQVRNDWRALCLPTLSRAVLDGGVPYLGALIVSVLLLTPAVAAAVFTQGS